MQYLISILCLAFVFIVIAGLHLYTMKKIDNVQQEMLVDGKDWKQLEQAKAGSWYTLLMLFLFSTLIVIPVIQYVKLQMFLSYIGGN